MSKKNKPIRSFKEIRTRAKELRKQSAPAEKLLWEQLRNRRLNGLNFRRQHPTGPYILDFYSPAYQFAIEIDGESHSFQGDEDLSRTHDLEDMGIKVIRFWNYEIEQN